MAQSLSQLHVHLIFSTKDRKPRLSDALQPDLWGYMAGILKNRGCLPIAVGGHRDHVHLLFLLSQTLTLAETVKQLKVSSARWLREHQDRLADFRWQAGYAAFSVSASKVKAVVGYIENQSEHHRTISFKEELIEFLERHGVAHDERFLWE